MMNTNYVFRLQSAEQLKESQINPLTLDLNNCTLQNQIDNNTIVLTNYLKHDFSSKRLETKSNDGAKCDRSGASGKRTGRALLMNQTTNLSVVDIDITKTFDDDTKEAIRNDIVSKLSPDDIIVKTASGGIHVYCKTDDFPVDSNRMVKCYKCDDYDIDLFSGFDKEKRSLVVLPGSKVRQNARCKINSYTFIRGSYESIITRSLRDVLDDLNISINNKSRLCATELRSLGISCRSSRKQRDENPINDLSCGHDLSLSLRDQNCCPEEDAYNTITEGPFRSLRRLTPNELAERIIDGLFGIEIHNDAGNMSIDDEVTLFTLFQAINALPDEYIDRAYDKVKNDCILTPNAESNFDKARERYRNVRTSPFILIKILKIWNTEYYVKALRGRADYDTNIKSVCANMIESSETHLDEIDLNDTFDMNVIRSKAEHHMYTSDEDVLVDLSRVIRYIDDGTDSFVMKAYDTFSDTFALKFVNDSFMTKNLKRIELRKKGKKKITVYSVFEMNQSKFCKRGVKFNSHDKSLLSLFHGYKYKILDEVNFEKIQLYLDLIREIICDASATCNDDVYNYVLNWIAFIIQNPGIKSETALVLKGLQGIGKNRFTDILCELMSGYSAKNITEIAELTGQFNSVVEGKMLIILNELKNCGDDRLANFNALKSIITDDEIRINEKNQPRRTAQNVANFIFVSNNSFPVKIETGDRRYCVLNCNGRRKGDFAYFEKLMSSTDTSFYDNLLTFFMKRDISGFNIRVIPMTDAKQDLIDASKPPIDVWICDNYDELCEGMACSKALRFKPVEMKERAFQLQLKDKCERKRRRINGDLTWYYILKDDCRALYYQHTDPYETEASAGADYSATCEADEECDFM